MHPKFKQVLVVGILLTLAGCFEDDKELNHLGSGNPNPNIPNSPNPDPAPDPDPDQSANQPPTIAGAPPRNILEGELYEFTPSGTDPDGDPLEFSVSRKPVWAKFDKATGRIWGTPGAEHVGNFTNISISVTDGKATASLGNFDISVDQIAAGSATLSWTPPSENADGSPLTDLAGYRIYYGRNQDNLTRVVELDNPGLSRHVVENLTTARWYFQMTTRNSNGAESARSQAVSKIIG